MRSVLGRSASASVLLVAVIAASAVLTGGCSAEDGPDGAVVKIGVHTSLTGGLAEAGADALAALELAAQDFSGFEVDGITYDIELVIADDRSDPSEAPVAAQELVDAGVVGVIGALTSGSTGAALPLYELEEVPLISGSATMAALTDAGFENFFRTCLRDDLQGRALAEWVIELGFRKAVIIDNGTDYSVSLADQVQMQLGEGRVVEIARLEGEVGDEDFAADYTVQVGEVASFEPDVVVFTGYSREGGILRSQLVDAGLGGIQFMGGDGIRVDEIATAVARAEDAEGLLATYGGLSAEQMPGYAEFAERFEQYAGAPPAPYAETHYDALGALVQAIVDAQSFEGPDIVAALREVRHEGVSGTVGFNAQGDVVIPGEAETRLIPRYRFDGQTWALLR